MEVFRIVEEKFSGSISASGAIGRWNESGQQVVYTSSSRSLATLELVIHRSAIKPASKYKVLVISIADEDHLFKQVMLSDLPRNWREISRYAHTQGIGAGWYLRQDALALKVPSAVIVNEFNYVINTNHPAFSRKVTLVRQEDYFWDSRLRR